MLVVWDGLALPRWERVFDCDGVADIERVNVPL
jgi:hypothetical protein